MRRIIFGLLMLLAASCHAQETKAVRDDLLPVSTTGGMNGGCMFLERPVYYINQNYVVYQDCNTRKILHADVSTFRGVKFYDGYGMALDKNGVYVRGNFVATDTTGFTFLGNNEKDLLWKTNASVYKNTTALPHLNAAEFSWLPDQSKKSYSQVYFKDSHNIYFFDKKVEGADVNTADLVYNDNRLFYDKNYMYSDGEIVTFEGEPLLNVNNSLKKTATKVLYNNKVVPNIDAKTLVGLSRYYARDKNNVYYTQQALPIKKADFSKIKVWDHTNSAYLTDGRNLFYHEHIFPEGEFDVATFNTFGFTDIVYDKNGVYTRRYDSKLEKVVYDKLPFKYTDAVSTKNLQITEGSNLYVYYKDQAYNESNKTLYENLTPQQIEISRTSAHTANMSRLTKLDGKTMLTALFDYKLEKIDDGIYFDGKKTGADAGTFRQLGNYYADKDNVYLYNRQSGLQPIPYLDAKTAKNFNSFVADKDYLYSNNTQVIKSDKLEILASFPGYRLGCGSDTTPGSDFYLFRNAEGFWWVKVSNIITIRFLGKELNASLSPLFENLEIPGK